MSNSDRQPGTSVAEDGQRFDAPIDRSWDHLEAIASTLSNLRGAGALAHELIQNADDAQSATELTFRFNDEALTVIDDGGFRKCDNLRSADCAWERDGSRCCDFHAFAKIGGATKKHDPSTTGAFGIGFLSVYQVTDRPEIISADVHWIVDERNQQMLPCLGCDRDHGHGGTQIVLPWATSDTWLRGKLGAPVIGQPQRKALLRAFVADIADSMLFLRRINRIEVLDGDHSVAQFERTVVEGHVHIDGPKGTTSWSIVSASFEDAAAALRRDHPQIGRRGADVTLALRGDVDVPGRLYATLPTQVATELPLHINATFFPRLDRKGILLEDTPEGAWNRAVITAAAEALAASLEPLAHELGPVGLWRLIGAASRLSSHHGQDAQALLPIWDRLAPAIPPARIMWTTEERWEVVSDTVLAPRTDRAARLLADLEIPTVSRQIRSLVPDRRLGIRTIDLPRLISAIERLELEDGAAAQQMAAFLADDEQRAALTAMLAELAAKADIDDPMRDRIRALAIWQGIDGRMHTFESAYLVDRRTAPALGPFVKWPLIVWPRRGQMAELGQLADHLSLEGAVEALEQAPAEQMTVPAAVRALKWLQGQELPDELVERLREVPLLPSQTGLRAARETVRAGGFADHLAVTGVLDDTAGRGLDQIIERLGVQPLTFIAYLSEHLPAALAPGAGVSITGLVELIRECARRREEIDAAQGLAGQLAALQWVPCRDGIRRRPTEVYFHGAEVIRVLGDDVATIVEAIPRKGGATDFLRDLGAALTPRPVDVVGRVAALTTAPFTPAAWTSLKAVLAFIASRERQLSQPESLGRLRSMPWLAADGSDRWHTPNELYTSQQKRLFASTGRFIALPRGEQTTLSSTLGALGVQTEPTVALVVGHLRHVVGDGHLPPGPMLRWLDERADDPSIGLLADVAFLLGRDGALHRPDAIFRDLHPLRDRLPVLEAGQARHRRLLEALAVKRTPSGADAAALLATLTDDRDSGDTADQDVLRSVRACWQIIALDSGCELDELAGLAVVIAPGGVLRRVDEVVVDDVPSIPPLLSPQARSRVVADEGIGLALARAGTATLSQRLVAQIAGRSRAKRERGMEARLIDRQSHVARLVVAEHGQLTRLLSVIERLKVRSLPDLQIRYSLESIDVEASSPISRGAHYDAESGELLVRGGGDDVDWGAVAVCLKDVLLPDQGPAATMPLGMVLAAETTDAAAGALPDALYPKLSEERWDELRAALLAYRSALADDDELDSTGDNRHGREHDGQASTQDHDVDEEPDVDDDSDDDDAADDGSDEDGASDHDEEGQQDQADESDQGRADHNAGGQRSGAGGDGRGASGSRSGGSRSGGSGAAEGRGRSENGGGGGSSADHRLISYVDGSNEADRETADERDDRSAAGDAGVDLVITHLHEELAGQDLEIVKMPDMNKGYDVLVRRRGDRSPVRYIEVKSTDGRWGLRGIGLSRAQFDMALVEGERYWLYVVEFLYEPDARIWAIRDPARRVGAFQFDHGWSGAAEHDPWVQGARRPPTTD